MTKCDGVTPRNTGTLPVVSQFVISVPYKARDELQRESNHCFFDFKMDATFVGMTCFCSN